MFSCVNIKCIFGCDVSIVTNRVIFLQFRKNFLLPLTVSNENNQRLPFQYYVV